MSDAPYHPFYCEENAWHLCRRLGIRSHALFVSNARRQVVMFAQRAAGELPYVVWDYHVVALAPDAAGRCWVHDPDCTAGTPLPLSSWLTAGFPHVGRADPAFDPLFRPVPAPRYLADFASDRRHMRRGDDWLAPPPPWPAIGSGFNLFDFVPTALADDVLDLDRLRRRFCADERSR